MTSMLYRGLIVTAFACSILPGVAFAQQAYRVRELSDYFPDTTKALVIQRAASRVADTLATQAAGEEAPARVVLRPGDIIKPAGESRDARVTLATDTTFQVALPSFLHVDKGSQARLLVPRLLAVGGGLTFRDGAYRGSLRVALQDSLSPSQAVSLDPHVAIQLIPIDVGEIDPEEISVSQTNHYQKVDVVSRMPPDTVQVMAVTPADLQGVKVGIPVHRPRLRLTAIPSTLQGFGLETSILAVAAPLEWSGDSLEVTLSSDRGQPEPSTVLVRESRGGTSLMRSARLGSVEVWAETGGFRSNTAVVNYIFPFWFLGAAVLGALLGGFLSKRKTPNPRSTGVYLVTAVLTGLLMALAYVAGINLFVNPLVSVPVPTLLSEVLVFVLAALGAYYGLPGRLKSSG